MIERDISIKAYTGTFLALLVLLAMTVGASFLHFGSFNLVISMAIAVAKGLLVAVYFMHLRNSERLTWIYAGAAVVWLMIALVLTMSDYLTRVNIRMPGT